MALNRATPPPSDRIESTPCVIGVTARSMQHPATLPTPLAEQFAVRMTQTLEPQSLETQATTLSPGQQVDAWLAAFEDALCP